MIKLIATDVDGTLVKDSSPRVYPEIFEEIRRLKEKGIICAIASGRQYHSVAAMFAPVAENLIFIVENGAHIRCRDTDISVMAMKNQDAEEIIRDIRCKGLDMILAIRGMTVWIFTNTIPTGIFTNVQQAQNLEPF